MDKQQIDAYFNILDLHVNSPFLTIIQYSRIIRILRDTLHKQVTSNRKVITTINTTELRLSKYPNPLKYKDFQPTHQTIERTFGAVGIDGHTNSYVSALGLTNFDPYLTMEALLWPILFKTYPDKGVEISMTTHPHTPYNKAQSLEFQILQPDVPPIHHYYHLYPNHPYSKY